MNRSTIQSAFVLLILSLLSCQAPRSINKKQITADITTVLMEQEKAWNEGDIEQYMQGYQPDDSLRFASGGHVSYGWHTTLERYRHGYPDKATMGRLAFSELDIKIISKEAALVFGKWELKRAQDSPWGLFTLLFIKGQEGWRIVHDHTSSAN